MATDKRIYETDGTIKRKEVLIAGQRSDGDFQYFLIDDDGKMSIDAELTDESVQIEDSTGSLIDPAKAIDQPDNVTTGHDLIGTGDLTLGPVAVNGAAAVIISAKSTDSNAFSVSVSWQDDSGNEFQTEDKTEVGLSSVTDDWARLVRKGKQIEVTVTDESGGASNNVNVYLDTHR